MKIKALILGAFLGWSPLWAIDQAIGPFSGLNNEDNAAVIPADKAQDLLNVDLSDGGRSVLKRDGYGLAYALSITTSPVHGVHNFFDSSGNDVALAFNDTRMTASVNGGSATVLFSTGPNGATYQCTDSQGFAYCVNTTRNNVIKTNGQTYSFLTTVSTGTMITVTPDRLVQSGIAAAPNRVDFSAAADFTSWTTGVAPTSAFQFTISAPGSRVTHITYAFNRVMWFKDASFGYIIPGQTAADWVVQTVSPNVGTLDNTSVYYQGILYFRGQDSHIWSYDGSNLVKLTRDIGGTIGQSQSRASNSWTQTTQADFQAGSFSPDGWQDTTTLSGSLKNGATSFLLTNAADWSTGTVTAGTAFYVDTHTVSGSLQTTFPENFATYRNGSGSTKLVWVEYDSNPSSPLGIVSVASNKMTLAPEPTSGRVGLYQGTPNFLPSTTWYFTIHDIPTMDAVNYFGTADGRSSSAGQQVYIQIGKKNGNLCVENAVINSAVHSDPNCAGETITATLPTRVAINVSTTNAAIQLNGSTVLGGSHSFSVRDRFFFTSITTDYSTHTVVFSDFSIVPQTFTWTSSVFDTGISSPSYSAPIISTSNPTNALSFTGQVSTDNVTYDSAVSISSGTTPSFKKRYFKMNVNANQISTASVSSVSDFFLGAFSSGTFYSQVKNAANLTAWDTLGVTKQETGGVIQLYIRSSTNSITITSSTPSWTAVGAGAVPTISTGTYFQIRGDFIATSSTQIATLSDFTQNWFEGSASDKSYATYFDDAIWWSVASGAGATSNNTILKFDLTNTTWLKYDIPINGFYSRQNRLYFGSAVTGNVFKYGDSDSDNGTAIEAYWKSKDFFMSSPFTDDDVTNLSFFFEAVANSSMTVTYAVNGSSETSYTVPLARTTASYGRNNRNLPLGTVGNTFNVKFGNDASDQPFEVFAIQYGVTPKSWKPENQ